MIRPGSTVLVLALAAGLPAEAHATPEADASPTILVTADRIASSAADSLAARREAPSARTVIDAEQLGQFGELPLGDALRRMPGVTFDGGNRARELRLRGIGDEYAQVLLNGQPFIDGNSRRSAQLDRIPSILIRRAEIIRSPVARLNGEGAAGTLNLILPTGDFDRRARFNAALGDIDQQGAVGEFAADLAGRRGDFGGALAGGWQRNRRAESKDSLVFRGDGSPNGGELQANLRRYRQAALLPSAGVTLGARSEARLEGLWLWTEEKRRDERTELLANQVDIRRRTEEDRLRERENGLVRATLATGVGERGRLELALDWQASREDTERDERRFTAAGIQDRSRQRSESIRLERLSPSLVAVIPLDRHTLRGGIDWSELTRRERNAEIDNGVPRPPNLARVYDIDEQRVNFYAEDVWALSDRATLAFGARIEWSQTDTEDATGARGRKAATYFLPNANLRLALAPDLDLRAGVARTLRRPNLRELSPVVTPNAGTIANPDIGGNPETAPERIWGLDAGLDRYLGRDGLIAVSGFWRQFDDKIEFLPQAEAGRIVSRPQNVGRGRLTGLEAEARVPLSALAAPWLTLWGNATLIRTRLEAADAVAGGRRRFLDQPDAVLNGGIDLFAERLRTTFGTSLNWNSGYAQERRLANADIRRDEVDAILRWDVSARAQLARQLSLSVSATNLLGQVERTRTQIRAPDGAVRSLTRISEPTYRSVFVRLGIEL